MPPPTDFETYDLGDLPLASGGTLPEARLAYKTFGTLNAERSNAVLFPTWFSGYHTDNEWLVGPGKTLDPSHYFIIMPNQLGNGLSSSPSNTSGPRGGADFPPLSFRDQIAAQHAFVTQQFGITELALVVGSSMGAAQTFQWAVSHSDMVARAAPICGSPKTSEHNQVFLASLRAALTADQTFADGHYDPADPPVAGLRAFARIYAGWGLSQAFYWQQAYQDLGFSTLEEFLTDFWEAFFLDGRDPNNLLSMLEVWATGDIGETSGFAGDTEAALRSIRCPLIDLPCRTDLYFPPEDEQHWAQFIPNGEVRVVPTIYGHFGGLGFDPDAITFIDQALAELMTRQTSA